MDTVRDMTEGKAFLRPGEVARITGISLPHIYSEIRTGNLPATRYRVRTLLIKVEDFYDWMDTTFSPVEPEVIVLDTLSEPVLTR